jgi:hypothetical protein
MESKNDSTLVVYTKRVNVCGTRSAGRKKFNKNVNGKGCNKIAKYPQQKKHIMVLQSTGRPGSYHTYFLLKNLRSLNG